MNENQLAAIAEAVAGLLRGRGWMLVTAESCTGGGIARALTDRAGSSEWFERGFVTYSNEAKQEMLGVAEESLEEYGAVSETVAKEMAVGALVHSGGQVCLAVTGIAGPTGGTRKKPVGTVWFAWAAEGCEPLAVQQLFEGDR